MSSEIADILDREAAQTEAGNYFVANYPPFAYWGTDTAARVGELLR